MAVVYNYYWDINDPARPFISSLICNNFSLVPKNATREKPPKCKKGTIQCWDGTKWIIKLDWRQQKLYSKKTGKLVKYPTVDPDNIEIEKNYTVISPSTLNDKWENGKWVIDEEALRNERILKSIAKRNELLEIATKEISIISDIIFFKESTNADDLDTYKLHCNNWRIYRGKLASIKFITGNEIFPEQPIGFKNF